MSPKFEKSFMRVDDLKKSYKVLNFLAGIILVTVVVTLSIRDLWARTFLLDMSWLDKQAPNLDKEMFNQLE